jgi:COP9 signalosome complex subunit 6
MSEEKQECSLMAPASTAPSVLISLHPLVIMNVADHWTRIKAQLGKPTQGFKILL